MRVLVDGQPTVVNGDYCSNQSLAGFIERAVEGIAIDQTSQQTVVKADHQKA